MIPKIIYIDTNRAVRNPAGHDGRKHSNETDINNEKKNLNTIPTRLIKRALSLLFVICTFWAVVPIGLILALLIKVTSKGPVFYRQKRIGQYGREINVLKFRSMIADADQHLNDLLESNPQYLEEWNAIHKIRNDPRVTGFGKFLRKTSLDELPQVWNILIGEMSLIGPRPIVQAEAARYQDVFELYKQVKPGITGLWQVLGRNDTSYAERVSIDAYYIRHWSIWLDLYILARTVWVVVRRTGAF